MSKKLSLVEQALASRREALPPNLRTGTGVILSTEESSASPLPLSSSSLREGEEIVYVEIERLAKNPYQPRMGMDEAELLGLMFSILKNGLWDPLPTRVHPENKNQYQLAAGHRRREALRRLLVGNLSTGTDVAPYAEQRQQMRDMLAKDPAIKGLVGNRIPIVIREYSDKEMAEIAWQENARRSPLTISEEGALFLQRRKLDGLTQVALASELGVEETYVKRREAAARDPEDIQRIWAVKPDSLRAISYLRQLGQPEDRAPIIKAFLAGELTTDQVRDAVEAVKDSLEIREPIDQRSFPSESAREHPTRDDPPTFTRGNEGDDLSHQTVTVSGDNALFQEESTAPASARSTPSAQASSSAFPVQESVLDPEAAVKDRASRAREVRLQNALRTLIGYHKELRTSGAAASEKEIQIRASIEGLLEDIRRAQVP